MTNRFKVLPTSFGSLVLLVTLMAITVTGQSSTYGTQNGEWQTYGGDLQSTRYSALDQINADNFSKLQVAWRFKTDNFGPRPDANMQSTPLVVKGVMYLAVGTRRSVVAIDPQTGETLWMYRLDEGARGEGSIRPGTGHGVTYWTDGKEERIVYVTPGHQLVALNAKTGIPVSTFGRNGIIDLKTDVDQVLDPVTGELGLHSTPLVVNDVIVVGAAHRPSGGPTTRKNNAKGYVRGYDARTGKRLWIFHTIPQPGEFGNETWLNDSWSWAGNTGVWAQMSADPELNLVYMGVEMPTGDYYGGNRPGNHLFSESLVALDVKTGARKWHYQLVHHGLWDHDVPCAPILADLNVNGKLIKAIALPTKQSWVYTFDRATGAPVWPIEERAVEKGTVPGEWYSPTQPFVTKPPAFDRQGVSINDLIDFTPELRAEAVKLISRYKIGPMFTPPVVSKWEGPLGTIMLPNATGGANWQGGALDPDTNMLYVFSNTTPFVLSLLPADPARSDFGWVTGRATDPKAPAAAAAAGGGGRGAGAGGDDDGGGGGGGRGGGGGGGGGLTVQGLPLIKPPYGRITALDMNKGELVWQIAHGDTPDNIKNHPALKGLNIPRTGRQGRLGVLATKTLLIAGEGGFATTPNGRGAMLRAYEKATGKDVGAVYMPAPQTGSPMTYMINGRQYLTVTIGGAGYPAELLVFKLPG
jgi:quinoprotein glucose dehydrogenase